MSVTPMRCVWVLVLCVAGCSSAPEGAEVERAAQVEAFEARLAEVVGAQASSEVDAASFGAAMQALTGQLKQGELIRSGYSAKAHKRAFVLGGRLTPAGTKLHEVLSKSHLEGLDPKDYHSEALASLKTALEGESSALQSKAGPQPPLSEDQREALTEVLETAPEGGDVDALLYAGLVKAAAGTPLEAWLGSMKAGLGASGDKEAQAEVLLMDGALRYALDMRHANTHDVKKGEGEGDRDDAVIIRKRQEDFVGALHEAASKGESAVGEMLTGLRPPNPQYEKLVALLARYEAMAKAGGWPTKLPKIQKPKKDDVFKYKGGFKSYPAEVVSLVKARLKGEGYYEGPVDNTWEEAFSQAVLRYRKDNLLREKNWIDYEMVQAMRLPVEWRVAQIKVNLKRLRAHRIWDDDYYVHINVPEYFAEVWDGGERKLRFKVIVGSRKKYRDKKTRRLKFPDETPLLTDKMEKIIFNPDWMVPGRIRVQLMRQAKGKPDFWKENGYEILPGKNRDLIRQKPGKNNALGQVKFLFPNEHGIYMHDTPKKALFNEDVRAFSHGCMRVHKPLDFAHYMLSREDKQWTERRVRINAQSGKQFNVELKDGPAVYIDYITVKVDDEGAAVFMWDIYRKDIAEIKARYDLDPPSFDPHYP